MAEEGAILKITRNLKNAVSAILQGYGDGQGPVTDSSAELHRFCGCLELLLQFDQKEQRSFLGVRKDYWDFLFTTLRRQRGYTEQTRFICSQDKLKTSLGKGRAFIRLCLTRGQLAESIQLCLLSPDVTREWYGPRSPLLCPELQEDILDSLYALSGVAFDLDLQRPDLDEAWPMFSESCCSNPSRTQERRPRRPKGFPKEVSCSGEQLQGPECLQDAAREDHHPTFLEKKKGVSRSLSCSQNRKGFQLDQEGGPKNRKSLENSASISQQQREEAKGTQQVVTGMDGGAKGSLPETGQRSSKGPQEKAADRDHDQGLQGKVDDTVLGNRQEWDQPGVLGQPWVLQSPGIKKGSSTEKLQEWTRVTSVSGKEDQAGVPMQEVVKDPRYGLQLAREQAQHQEQLLRAQEVELQNLQEQLSRCEAERARLQVILEQQQEEAGRRGAMYEKELEGQRDLVRAMKRRVLELIHEKDLQWQRLHQLSTVAPGHCVGCSKVFRRLSRRYPCRLCGSFVCHACSVDHKKREHCCPACAQLEEIQVT